MKLNKKEMNIIANHCLSYLEFCITEISDLSEACERLKEYKEIIKGNQKEAICYFIFAMNGMPIECNTNEENELYEKIIKA